MICRPHNRPAVNQDIDAMLCWMDDRTALTPGKRYTIKHTTRSVKAMVRELQYRLDVNTLHRQADADRLHLNEVGRYGCARRRRCSRILMRAAGAPGVSSSSMRRPTSPWGLA